MYEIAGNDHHHIVCRNCGDVMQVEHTLLEQLYHKLESISGRLRTLEIAGLKLQKGVAY